MALIHAEFRSQILKRIVPFYAILPLEKYRGPYPTLYLLHGLTDNASSWLTYTSIRRWAENSGLAVIMPSAENSFYVQVGNPESALGDFGEYIGRELVEVTREMFPLSRKYEDTFIAGLSMGGYGACRNALKYHDVFSKAAILSGALHFYEYPKEWVETTGNTIGELFSFYPLEKTRETDLNPRYLIGRIQQNNGRFPDFYVCCGLQDNLLMANRSIAKALTDAGANVTYVEDEGSHEWMFWDKYIQHVLKWLNYSVEAK